MSLLKKKPKENLVRIDIDMVPEPLYQSLLAEFRRQYGQGYYDEWIVTAVKESRMRH